MQMQLYGNSMQQYVDINFFSGNSFIDSNPKNEDLVSQESPTKYPITESELTSFFRKNYPTLAQRYDYERIKEATREILEKIEPKQRISIMNWVIDNIKDYGITQISPDYIHEALTFFSLIPNDRIDEFKKLMNTLDVPPLEISRLRSKKFMMPMEAKKENATPPTNIMYSFTQLKLLTTQTCVTQEMFDQLQQQIVSAERLLHDSACEIFGSYFTATTQSYLISESRLGIMKGISRIIKWHDAEEIKKIVDHVKGFFDSLNKDLFYRNYPDALFVFFKRTTGDAYQILNIAKRLIVPETFRKKFINTLNTRSITTPGLPHGSEYKLYYGFSHEIESINHHVSDIFRALVNSKEANNRKQKTNKIIDFLCKVLKESDFLYSGQLFALIDQIKEEKLDEFINEFFINFMPPYNISDKYFTISKIAKNYI